MDAGTLTSGPMSRRVWLHAIRVHLDLITPQRGDQSPGCRAADPGLWVAERRFLQLANSAVSRRADFRRGLANTCRSERRIFAKPAH